jgi:hypothetical protein
MQSWDLKNVKLFWERTHSEPPFFQTLNMTVEINEKKLYYNYNTSGSKFLTLKYKFQVTPPIPQLQMLRNDISACMGAVISWATFI